MVYFWGMFGSLLSRNILSQTASNISVNPFSLRDWESYLQFFGSKFTNTFMRLNCRNSYILEHCLQDRKCDFIQVWCFKIFFEYEVYFYDCNSRQVKRSDFKIHRKVTHFNIGALGRYICSCQADCLWEKILRNFRFFDANLHQVSSMQVYARYLLGPYAVS